jgi:hypothetical protein
MRFAILLASVFSLVVTLEGPLMAQIQSGGVNIDGGRPPASETPADVRKKAGICNKAVGQYKLRGADRKKYLDQCNAARYVPGFKAPPWPLT